MLPSARTSWTGRRRRLRKLVRREQRLLHHIVLEQHLQARVALAGLAEVGFAVEVDVAEDVLEELRELGDLGAGETATVVGTVRTIGERKLRGRKSMVSALLEDETGGVALVWFNQPWVKGKIARGDRLRAIGAVTRRTPRAQRAPRWA